MAVQTVTDGDFEEKVINSQTPVVVDFFAVWCGPCKMAEPVLEELSKANAGKVAFFKLDVDQNPMVSQKYGVMSIPTTILFKNKEEVGRQIGFAGKQGFEELIKKAD